jgi:hypothetical protein
VNGIVPDYALVLFFAASAVVLALILARAMTRRPAPMPQTPEAVSAWEALESSLRSFALTVEMTSGPFGTARLHVRAALHEDGPERLRAFHLWIWPAPKRLYVKQFDLPAPLAVRLHIPRPKGIRGWFHPFRTGDELFDDACAVRAPGIMAGWIATLVETGRLTDSVVVLRRLPGVRSMTIEFFPHDRCAIAEVALAHDGLLKDPRALESLLVHLDRIGGLLALETDAPAA